MKFFLYIILFFSSLTIKAQDTISFYFVTDKYELSDRESTRLEKWIESNQKSKILAIHGFTDDEGTSAHNDTLSQRRVRSLYTKIKDRVAIRDDFKTISYGENFVQDADKAKNRRASIYFIKEHELEKENVILGLETEEEFLARTAVPIPENATLSERIALSPIGSKIVLKNINFFQSTFAITPESNEALYDLLFVMENNPNLHIQIQGHICCVDKDHRNLSLERAKQVRRFLVFKGVKQYRVSVTGFGVSQPLYPIPEATEEQAAANRRVEIEIIKK